jgi:hypothetical protein
MPKPEMAKEPVSGEVDALLQELRFADISMILESLNESDLESAARIICEEAPEIGLTNRHRKLHGSKLADALRSDVKHMDLRTLVRVAHRLSTEFLAIGKPAV